MIGACRHVLMTHMAPACPRVPSGVLGHISGHIGTDVDTVCSVLPGPMLTGLGAVRGRFARGTSLCCSSLSARPAACGKAPELQWQFFFVGM
jgi:hypothetical protein